MNPSTLRRLALAALLLLLAVGGWFFFGRRPAAESAKPTPSAPAATAAVATPPPAAAARANSTAVAPAAGAERPAANFASLLDEARRIPEIGRRTPEIGRVLGRWLEQDPSAALAYVRQLPRGADFTPALLLTLDAIGRRDPDRALALARELAVTREELAIYSSLFAQLGQQDAPAAAQRLSLVPPGLARENAVRALADEWARRDFSAALAWSRQLDANERAAGVESVIAALVPTDPLRAIQLAQQSLTGAPLGRTLAAALQKMAETDVGSAASIVASLPAGETQLLAAANVARAFAAQNIDGALAWANTLPAGTTQQLALKNVLEIWATRDAAAAGNFVSSLPSGPMQHALAIDLASSLARVDVASAIAWTRTLPVAETQAVALSRIADAWAQRDPVAASQWVVDQSAGPVAFRVETLGYTLSYWIQKDAPAAAEFIRGLPADLQPRVAASSAPILVQRDPPAAMAWAQSLPVPAARESALAAAFARWSRNAPEAARIWLGAADLPVETKTRMIGVP